MHMNFLNVFFVIVLVLHTSVYAEVIPDNTVNTKVTPISETGGRTFEISDGLQNGINLFHSFREFGLDRGELATFTGRGVDPETVQNILARVTGGNPSNIYGQISTKKFTAANLYLMNPNGILFGKGASLDLSGSLHATTADYIRLGNGDPRDRFWASLSNNSRLLSAPPSAFGFLGTPASINIHNTLLQVSDRRTLSLIGGNIRTENSGLSAPGGRVNLASVASAGEVIPTESGSSEPETLKVENLTKGMIKLSGYFSNSEERPVGIDVSGNGGQIFIRAGKFFANKTLIQANYTCCIQADTHGQGGLVDKGGLVDIAVDEDIHLNNTVQIVADNYGNSREGNSIKLTANSLEIGGMDMVELRSFLVYKSQYTSTKLNNEHQISVEDASTFLKNAKALLDEPTDISFEDVIEKFGKQDLADKYRRNFFVRMFNLISIGNRSIYEGAGGGKINIDVVQNLQMDTGIIEAYTVGAGNAGSVTVNAENVALTGLSGINAATFFNPNESKGGVSLKNGGGAGNGGNLTVNARKNLSVSDYSYISTSVDEHTKGKAGDLTLNTSRLTLDTVGRVNSYSSGTGDAGDITITADKVLLNDNTYITTEATQSQASGGNIDLHVRDWLVLFNSKITAEARGNQQRDNGGNLTIDGPGPEMLALSKSQLLAKANQSYGGDINLHGAKYRLGGTFKINKGRFKEQDLEEGDYNVIDASSRLGIEFYGKIDFNAQPWEFPGLLPLPEQKSLPLLSQNRCSFRKEDLSRFLITARDILPRSPEDLRTHTIRVGK